MILLAALGGAMHPPIAFKDEAVAARGPVTLGQVADVSALPASMRRRASDLVLIERPARVVTVSHRVLASRARSLMPALAPWLGEIRSGTLRLEAHHDAQPVRLVSDGGSRAIRGGSVTVVTRAGPFTIERRGTAVQDARSGERGFVRFADGSVVSATCCR